ncbi:MAG: hypothetical protein LBI31_04460 [Zoogloeaceae bacterium]|jgi:hypothetical protein|nr:hypothetical protein [Zoogloeaceae bacterium]
MTGEKRTKLCFLSCPPQRALSLALPLFLPRRQGEKGRFCDTFAARFPFPDTKVVFMLYAQVGDEGGKKILSPLLTLPLFFKRLIFKDFLLCLFKWQSWLFLWLAGVYRLFQAGIHKVIHRFWGQSEKSLSEEPVSENLGHPVLCDGGFGRASAVALRVVPARFRAFPSGPNPCP